MNAQTIADQGQPHRWLRCPHTLTLGTRATMVTPASRIAVRVVASKPGHVMFAPLTPAIPNPEK